MEPCANARSSAPGRLGKAAIAYDAVQNTSNFGQGVYRGNKLQAGLGVVGITGNVSGLASRTRKLEDLTQAATVDARTVDAVTGPNNANTVDKLCVEGQADEGLEWVSAPTTLPKSADDIRFSQNSVSFNKVDRTGKPFTYNDLVESMRTKGWQGDPVDVVRMPDGRLTSMDNTRIRAAREVGIEVK